MFYHVNKLWVLVLVLAHSRFNSYAPELVPIFYYCDKTRVQMFYFLNVHFKEDSQLCFWNQIHKSLY